MLSTLFLKLIMDFDGKKYPELKKFLDVSDKLRTIHEFLDWFMNKKKGALVGYNKKFGIPEKNMDVENLLETYFELNFDKMEIEQTEQEKAEKKSE